MTPKTLAELKNNEIVRKRLAKFMAHFSFRNSKLENLHDRITDDEMKELMRDVVDRSYAFIWAMFSSKSSNEIVELLKNENGLPNDWKQWDDPKIPKDLLKAAKRTRSRFEVGRYASEAPRATPRHTPGYRP